jgi:hypothetical protein
MGRELRLAHRRRMRKAVEKIGGTVVRIRKLKQRKNL